VGRRGTCTVSLPLVWLWRGIPSAAIDDGKPAALAASPRSWATVIAPRLFLFSGLVWLLWPVLRAIWRFFMRAEPDRAGTLVHIATEHLAG
jgi:hypothetical protein